MKRKITMIFPGGSKSTADIIIDKNGMRIENKEPSYKRDDSFIRDFICDCINMGSWKHSWHLNVSEANCKFSKKGKETRKKIRAILLKKIEEKKAETQRLKDAIQILGRWHY